MSLFGPYVAASAAAAPPPITVLESVFLRIKALEEENEKLKHENKALPVSAEDLNVNLLNAAFAGNIGMCSMLIDRGADFNTRSLQSGSSPLLFASTNNFKNVCQLLINRGANVNITNNSGMTPLHVACTHGHIDIVKLLLENGADLGKKTTTRNEWTPLFTAVSYGHVEICKLLIEKGADIYAKDKNGFSPYQWALKGKRDFESLCQLLSSPPPLSTPLVPMVWSATRPDDVSLRVNWADSADSSTTAASSTFPFRQSDLRKCPIKECGKVCINQSELETHVCSLLKTTTTTRKRIRQCEESDSKGEPELERESKEEDECFSSNATRPKVHLKNATAAKFVTLENLDNDLLNASFVGDIGRCSILIDRGANVNARSLHHQGVSPLHWASANDKKNVCQLLIRRGADVNATSNDGLTPLHVACDNGHLEIVKLLVNNGADLEKRTPKYNRSPLTYAVLSGHIEVAKILIEKGARY